MISRQGSNPPFPLLQLLLLGHALRFQKTEEGFFEIERRILY